MTTLLTFLKNIKILDIIFFFIANRKIFNLINSLQAMIELAKLSYTTFLKYSCILFTII